MKIANSLCVYLVWAKVDGAVDALNVGAPAIGTLFKNMLVFKSYCFASKFIIT